MEAVNEYLEDQEKAFYFEVIRKLEQRWAKCMPTWREIILKSNGQNFHSPVTRNITGQEIFYHSS